MKRLNSTGATFEPEAALHVSEVYWELMNSHVRPYMVEGDRVDRHKIASLTEITIVKTLPIMHDNEEARRHYNARLAFCCAMNVMKMWKMNRGVPMNRLYSNLDKNFSKAHIRFLEYLVLRRRQIPVFANAATWYLVEQLVKVKSGKA